MGKKWRTNKNSNRKHKRSKTKRMRGGLGINPFARKVTNLDIVRYLIKTKNPIDVQFIVPSKSKLPSMLSSNKIDKTVIFDTLEDMKGKLHYKEENSLEQDSSKLINFIIENDILRVNKEGSNLKQFGVLVNRTIKFVSDITNEVREDIINSEKDAKLKKEQDDQAEQEKNRILEEKKINTPKIINVTLLDTRTQKGMLKTTIIDWKTKYYDEYNKSTMEDDVFTKISVPKKEDNIWNFDFFLRCVALNHDIDNLDDKQKPILEQIIQSDLKTPPLKYTDEKSTEIIFTNPGLIYMAIPGKPETYRGCIIYDMDGKISNHIQLHTQIEDGQIIEYFNETTNDFKQAHPSIIMEEHLQKKFPQFKPESIPEVTTDAAEAQAVEAVTTDAVATDVTEANPVEIEADTKEAVTTDVVEGEAEPEANAVEEQGATVEEQGATEEEQGATEEVLPQDNKIKQTTIPSTKVIPSTKITPSTSKKNISVSNKEPVKVEEIELEMEGETNENVKPKEQPKKKLDPQINDELNELILGLLKI